MASVKQYLPQHITAIPQVYELMIREAEFARDENQKATARRSGNSTLP